jgi:MarR family transcriptional regulator, temperature-dependent positive regulator of motility
MSVEDGTALLQSPIHLLHRAGQCVGFIFSDEVHGGDLTPRQYTILAAVAREEGLSQTDLVTRTGIDRSTLADIIRRLVQKGWIQRRRTSADARVYAIRLTEEGREVLRQAEPAAQRVDEKVLSALSGEERDLFMRNLNTIVDALAASSAARPLVD